LHPCCTFAPANRCNNSPALTGLFRLLEGDAFENTICGAGGEEMTGMVGRVARDNAGGAPGNLDDKSMGHGVC